MRYALPLVLTLALLFTLQNLALRAVGGRTTKSESNFFSSVGRIQAGAKGKAEVMVLGSSITGRLPDRAQGFSDWATMGCDAGSAVDTLRAINEGILPSAPILIIEANTLQVALNQKPTEISSAMRRPWFRMGLKFPLLAAYARPSAFFYSKLLERRTGGFDIKSAEDLGVTSRPQLLTGAAFINLSDEEVQLIGEMHDILKRLKNNGIEVVIVWLPPKRKDESPPPAWILEIARSCSVPYWDLGNEADPSKVTLTDGVHMDAPSAARTVRSLQKVITESY